jgi:hypothetical protein
MSNGNAPQPAHLTPSQLAYADTSPWKVAIQNAVADLRCACPAIVVLFDPDTQLVAVQIAMKELVKYADGPKWVPIPTIYRVPIVLPRAGGMCITMPIAAGDEGLLVFTDTAFDLWWLTGGQQPQGKNPPIVQPQHERRRHDVTDCFFIPGCWNQTRVLANYPTDRIQIRSDDGSVSIDVEQNGNILINSSSNVNVNAQGTVNIISHGGDTTIDGVDFLLHTHSGVQPGVGDSGPVVP